MPFSDEEEIIQKQHSKATRYLLVCSFFMFFLSLFFTAFTTIKGSKDGLNAFLPGWLFLMNDSGSISWLANLFVILSWIFIYKKKRAGIVCSIIACVLAFSFLFFDTVITDESGTNEKILHIGLAYWLWCGSCLFSFLASLPKPKEIRV